MAALPADIAAGTRAATVVSWSSVTLKSRYPSARDGSASPAEGFFDSPTDAQTAVDQRGALIGADRRRFVVAVSEIIWFDPTTGIPTVTLVDGEQDANGNFLVARYELDLENEVTTLELFG